MVTCMTLPRTGLVTDGRCSPGMGADARLGPHIQDPPPAWTVNVDEPTPGVHTNVWTSLPTHVTGFVIMGVLGSAGTGDAPVGGRHPATRREGTGHWGPPALDCPASTKLHLLCLRNTEWASACQTVLPKYSSTLDESRQPKEHF